MTFATHFAKLANHLAKLCLSDPLQFATPPLGVAIAKWEARSGGKTDE